MFNAMRVDFAFGKSTGIELADGFRYRLLEARFAVPLVILAGLSRRPRMLQFGCPALAELARRKRSAAISVCDITCLVPKRELLPPILSRLGGAGIARDKTRRVAFARLAGAPWAIAGVFAGAPEAARPREWNLSLESCRNVWKRPRTP